MEMGGKKPSFDFDTLDGVLKHCIHSWNREDSLSKE